MNRIAESFKKRAAVGSLWEPREADLLPPSIERREPRLAGLRECAPFRIMLMRTRRFSRYAISLNGLIGIALLALLVSPYAGLASLPMASFCYLLAVLITVELPTLVTYARLRALLPDDYLPDLELTATPPEEVARAYWGAILYPPLMRQRAIASWIWFALFAALLLQQPTAEAFWIFVPGLFCSTACIALSFFSPWNALSFCAGALLRQRKWGEQRLAKRPAWALLVNLATTVADLGWNVAILIGCSLLPSIVYEAALHFVIKDAGFAFDATRTLGGGAVAVAAGAAFGALRGATMRRDSTAHLESMRDSVEALFRLRLEKTLGATESAPKKPVQAEARAAEAVA